MNHLPLVFRIIATIFILIAGIFGMMKSNELGVMTGKRDSLQKYYDDETQSHESTKDDLKLTRNSLKSSESENTALNADVVTKKAAILEKTRTISDLKNKIAANSKELQGKETDLKAIKSALVKCESKVPSFTNDQYDELQSENAGFLSQIDVLTADNDRMAKVIKAIPRPVGSGADGGAPTTVLAVEQRAGLLLIAAGTSHGVNKNSIYIVSKDGIRVAKITIAEADKTRSIASIYPGYGVPERLQPNDRIVLTQ